MIFRSDAATQQKAGKNKDNGYMPYLKMHTNGMNQNG